jgi:hypothetical protein
MGCTLSISFACASIIFHECPSHVHRLYINVQGFSLEHLLCTGIGYISMCTVILEHLLCTGIGYISRLLITDRDVLYTCTDVYQAFVHGFPLVHLLCMGIGYLSHLMFKDRANSLHVHGLHIEHFLCMCLDYISRKSFTRAQVVYQCAWLFSSTSFARA